MIELEDFPPDEAIGDTKDDSMTVEPPQVTEEPAPVEPKRKRGKRKVLRKTTQRDEKGYLGISCSKRC
jgi:hypothetical protein